MLLSFLYTSKSLECSNLIREPVKTFVLPEIFYFYFFSQSYLSVILDEEKLRLIYLNKCGLMWLAVKQHTQPFAHLPPQCERAENCKK